MIVSNILSIANTITAMISEAVSTNTALPVNSLDVGQVTLCANSS